MAVNMNRPGEHSLPAPNNEASRTPDVVVQQPGNSELQEPVDIRQHLDNSKLTIPETSACIPESSSSYAQSPRESVLSPFSTLMHDADRAPLRARNIIVFGESGAGKSSVINMIAGAHITQTSNDAVGCTFQYQCYQVLLDGLSLNLWDTVGLDEGTEGTAPARQAESSLKAFLHQISRWDGIDLLLYCVRGTRIRQALLRNYNIFYAAICRKKVPVALVVTGLENYEGDMEAWWTEHEKDLIKHGMRFDAHACVTTIHSDHPAIQDRLKQSRDVLRNLMQTRFDATTWRVDEGLLVSASFPDARALLRAAEQTVPSLIMICDVTKRANRIHFFPTVAGSQTTCIRDRKYECLYTDAQEVLFGDSFGTKMARQTDLLILHIDAVYEQELLWEVYGLFHLLLQGKMCPVIVVFGGLDSHEAAAEMWRLISSCHLGEMVGSPTYYPSPNSPREMIERADEALAALVEEKCPIKFEEKLTKFQKFCRNSRVFFTGRVQYFKDFL